MIGQVGAHSRQIHPHRDLDRAQMIGRPDAGAHQDRGTAEDPRAEDHAARLDDIAVEQPDPAVATDRHRAAVAVPRRVAEIGVRLEVPEVGEHVVEAPTGVPERGPLVVIRR
jgi:hypothetical protein